MSVLNKDARRRATVETRGARLRARPTLSFCRFGSSFDRDPKRLRFHCAQFASSTTSAAAKSSSADSASDAAAPLTQANPTG